MIGSAYYLNTFSMHLFLGCMDEESLETLLYDPLLSVFVDDLQVPMFSRNMKDEDLDPQNVLE